MATRRRKTVRRTSRRDDNLADRGYRDRARINVNESYERRKWAKRLGVTQAELVRTVRRVGVGAARVKAALGYAGRDPSPRRTARKAKRRAAPRRRDAYGRDHVGLEYEFTRKPKRAKKAKKRAAPRRRSARDMITGHYEFGRDPAYASLRRGRTKRGGGLASRTPAQRRAFEKMIAARRRGGAKKRSRRDWPGDPLGHKYAAVKGWHDVAATGMLKGKQLHRIYGRGGRDAYRDPAPKRRRKAARPTRRRATSHRRRDGY